ncbi:MAG: sugar porter family MFS transporter [Acidobacteriaceae bacterium]
MSPLRMQRTSAQRDSYGSIVYGFNSELKQAYPEANFPTAVPMKLNAYLIRSTLVGALGGLLFGFDIAAIAGTTHQLTEVFRLSSAQLGATISSGLIGTILGAMLSSIPAQKLGRRDTLRILAVLYLICATGSAVAWSWHSLLFFRLIGGMGIGGFSVLGPMYIVEIAPAEWRGRLVGTFQINIVVGILLGYISDFLIAAHLPGAGEWHWKLGVAAFPTMFLLLMLFTIGRSPRWLAMQGRAEEALQVLHRIGASNAEAELKEIVDAIHSDQRARNEPLFKRKYALPIFLAVTVSMFNQLSGVNAVLFYLNFIFMKAGFSNISSDRQSIYVGLANLLATLVAMTVIDKIGRKTLLLTGAVGMTICLTTIAVIFQTLGHQTWLLPLLVLFIISFAVSQGAVVWVYLGEVFPTKIRSKGQSLGTTANWITTALIAFIFPILAVHHAPVPFYFFAAMMALQFFVVLFIYPETKNLSLEQMQRKLGID